MPDSAAEIEDMFGERDRICGRWRFKGMLTGAFEGRAGDGSRFEAIVISLYRFRDDLVAEDWGAQIPLVEGHAWRSP